MLFQKKPTELIEWLNKNTDMPTQAFGIFDVIRSYGYNDKAIETIYPPGVKHNINAGLYVLHSESIDFDLIENLIKSFRSKYGLSYYLEQLITAILLERSQELHLGNALDYIVMPSKDQVLNQSGELHHYVAESKEWYFKNAWRLILNNNE
jgi:hypothetical protein